MFGESAFQTSVNGHDVQINLNHESFPEEELILRYTHVKLYEQTTAERDRRKASKVSEGL